MTGARAYHPTGRFIVATVHDGLASLPDGSVDCVITSPPYLRQRRYLPVDHPDSEREIGQEGTPAEFLEVLLTVMDELWRVMSDDATFWINLGTKHAGSGGAVPGGLKRSARRDATAVFPDYGHSRKPIGGWPLEQSVCWVSHLFGASLAYGRNLLDGTEHRQWVTRPPVTWCKPRPTVGKLWRTFRSATELIVYGGKHQAHYFDLDAVLEPLADAPGNRYLRRVTRRDASVEGATQNNVITADYDPRESKGVPPKNWWIVDSGNGYSGAHYATFPAELLIRPLLAGCPKGGTILDPFCGSGTTLVVATGHERNAIGIDFDPRCADLARERLGMLYTLAVTELPAGVTA